MTNPYETEKLLAEYLLFHYGDAGEILPYEFGPRSAIDFPVRVVQETLDVPALPLKSRALDLGCAVGRSTFELARHCDEVLGIDFSTRFIRTCDILRDWGETAYERVDEGTLTTPMMAKVDRTITRARARFEVGDACNLRGGLGTFDVVLMANLIDRLPDPDKCLASLPALIRPGGQLIIASPYTWLEEYTPPEKWLAGRFNNEGEPIGTLASLKEILAPNFVFRGTKDLPFLIREHARKFQWSVSQASLWRRR
ncbi:methyltransferase type 12 [Verrucomicrobia bacterium SCGC AG-212-E04]|nr:methyltransferase type 12 [Verrucomicrobia bacterium SCGC AG-212-E04]